MQCERDLDLELSQPLNSGFLCKRALMAPATKIDKIPESWERQVSRQASQQHFEGIAQAQAESQVQTVPQFSLQVHATIFLYTLYNTAHLH